MPVDCGKTPWRFPVLDRPTRTFARPARNFAPIARAIGAGADTRGQPAAEWRGEPAELYVRRHDRVGRMVAIEDERIDPAGEAISEAEAILREEQDLKRKRTVRIYWIVFPAQLLSLLLLHGPFRYLGPGSIWFLVTALLQLRATRLSPREIRAMESVTDCDDARAIPLLLRTRAECPDPRTVAMAEQCLIGIVERLVCDDQNVVAPDIQSRLGFLTADPSPALALAAARSLKRVGDPSSMADLLHTMGRVSNPPEIWTSAQEAIDTIRSRFPSEAGAVLLRSADRPPDADLLVATSPGPPGQREPERLLRSRDPETTVPGRLVSIAGVATPSTEEHPAILAGSEANVQRSDEP